MGDVTTVTKGRFAIKNLAMTKLNSLNEKNVFGIVEFMLLGNLLFDIVKDDLPILTKIETLKITFYCHMCRPWTLRAS